jgi:hypothetical protein
MSAQPSPRYQNKRPFTPEERSSFLCWKFGSTLDWCSQILVALNYPIEELRWFVDAVQGLCKGKEMRIAHSTLAKRAMRFKNKSQAKELAKRAIEANREWSRQRRCMIFDIESPKPHEMEGKDKRARTRYTDYLTPAAVLAQETEHKVKKADEIRWKRDAKYRLEKRQEILNEALKMLPNFECVEDMPESSESKDSKPLSLSEYVAQREKILLAENRRIVERVCDGDLLDADEIDRRLAALDVHYEKTVKTLEKNYKSARAVLVGLRQTRLTRAMNLGDVDVKAASEDENTTEKGNVDIPLVECAEADQEGDAHIPPRENGYQSFKGYAGVPLSDPAPEAEPEQEKGNVHIPLAEPVSQDELPQKKGNVDIPPTYSDPAPDEAFTQLKCALLYARLGLPVFPTKPDKRPYTQKGFKDASTDPAQIREWWQRWPEAGIGIPTGKASGWLVIDRDDRHGGDASLSALVEEHGDLPPTLEAATPSGGAHYIFNYPAHVEIGNSAGKLGKGLDLRGEGGYIVAPGIDPSRRWVNALDPGDMPEWTIERLLSDKHAPVDTDRRALYYPFAGGRIFSEGERSDRLRDVACGRWTHGYAEDAMDLYRQILGVRDIRCSPGKKPPPSDAELYDLALRTTRKYARGELKREVQL